MKINSTFTVSAPADVVLAYLLDVNKVAACVPGAELGEIVDSSTFAGKLKINVGAVHVTYQGTAHIVETEELGDRVIVKVDAKGKEIGGQGLVFAKLAMTIASTAEGGSTVTLDTDLNVAGKLAQFGRGVVEDISRKMVGEMSDCISANLQAAPGGGKRRK